MNFPVKISLVTTCKGRLAYLKESIHTWLDLDYNNYDIFIVDYDCPDRTEHFINKNKEKYLKNSKAKTIKVVKVNNKPYFNLNDARNIGIQHCDAELVFMIDSDIHIKDKRILKRIKKGIQKGMVFFSNLPVLNSNYVEALTFYNLLYHREVIVPAILPLISQSIGSTGTACFQKNLYRECGKYNIKINELGYGCDDMEFYLRYLNAFFYHHYLKKTAIPIDQALDAALVHFMTFPGATFRDIENPEEEKERFYPQNKESSALNTVSFIHRFFDHFPFPSHLSYETKRRWLKETDLQEFAIPSSFLHWFQYWYGRKLFEQNNLEKSQTYFKQLLQQKKVKPGYLAEAYFFLGEIQRRQGKKNFRVYYSQSLPFLLDKKGKSEKDLYFIASLYQRLGDYRKAKQWFQKILKSNRGTYLFPGVYFHLGEISYLEKRYNSANTYFLKCRDLNPLHHKCRKFLEELEKIEQAGEKDELK